MKIQSVNSYYGHVNNTEIKTHHKKQNLQQPVFQGTFGKINGAMKGSMLGALGWAIAAGTLPFLAPAIIAGAVTVGAIDSKLEDMANKDDKKNNK